MDSNADSGRAVKRDIRRQTAIIIIIIIILLLLPSPHPFPPKHDFSRCLSNYRSIDIFLVILLPRQFSHHPLRTDPSLLALQPIPPPNTQSPADHLAAVVSDPRNAHLSLDAEEGQRGLARAKMLRRHRL